MIPRAIRRVAALAAAATTALAACATIDAPRIAPGTPASELRARLGAPSEEARLPGGERAWYYVFGPYGFETWRYTLDSGDRVARAEQLLSERRFRDIVPGETAREDVRRMFGPPMESAAFPLSRTEAWTYRYRDGSLEMLGDIVFAAPTGRVLYYALYLDPRVNNSVEH